MTKDQAPAKMKIIYLSMAPWLCILLIAFSSKPGTIKPIPATNGTRAVIIEQPVMQDENKPSIAPVEMTKAKLSAVYGERIHPATGKNRLHSGVDFKAAEGVPVMATAAGVVAVSRFDSMLGNYVVINHSKTYATSYSHMKSCEVKFGDPVKLGQKIGYVGESGVSPTGPHLHYEVIKNGTPVDPKDYLPAN